MKGTSKGKNGDSNGMEHNEEGTIKEKDGNTVKGEIQISEFISNQFNFGIALSSARRCL